jgi:hypothetical protein
MSVRGSHYSQSRDHRSLGKPPYIWLTTGANIRYRWFAGLWIATLWPKIDAHHVDMSGTELLAQGRAIIIITSVATVQHSTAQHRHCSSYSEHSWTRYLPRFTMHSKTSSIMLRIYYPSSLAACASHNPGSKSTVGCVRTRSYTYLERELNRFTSQDREGLGRRWILFRIPCARRG